MVRRASLELPPVFRGADAVAQGVLTPQQLRGPMVRRVIRGVYRPVGTRDSHVLRCEAATLVVAGGQLTGTSMATILGVELASLADDVQVVTPDRSHQQAYRGVQFRRVTVDLDEGTRWRTGTLADPRRMAFDLAARVPHADAVARLDAVARAGLVDRVSLQQWLSDRTDNNLVAVRAAVAQMDPRAESLPESRCRVVLRAAGLDVVPQHVVRHHGTFVARVDLAVVEARVAIEYDGAWHVLREQLERDRRRLNALRDAGWVVVHVTADLLASPHELVGVVRRALVNRGD